MGRHDRPARIPCIFRAPGAPCEGAAPIPSRSAGRGLARPRRGHRLGNPAASPSAAPCRSRTSPPTSAVWIVDPSESRRAPAPTAAAMTEPAHAPKLVVAALLGDDAGRVLVTRRRPDQPLPLKWELPGGKMEAGEAPEQAL